MTGYGLKNSITVYDGGRGFFCNYGQTGFEVKPTYVAMTEFILSGVKWAEREAYRSLSHVSTVTI